METQTQITPVENNPIENIQEVMKSSKDRGTRIVNDGEKILLLELTAENDELVKTRIDQFKKALKDINEKRMPFTRKLDDYISQFTTNEKSIQNVINKLQDKRNQFVKKLSIEAEKQRIEQQKKEAQTNEYISLKSVIEIDIRSHVNELISKLKTGIIEASKTVAASNFEERFARLKAMPTELKDEKYFSFKNNLTGQFNDANNITSDLLKRLQTELKETYQQEIEQIKQEAILHFNNLARLSVEEKQKWIESEKEKIKLEKVTANEIASEKVEISKQAETTNVILDSISNDIIDVNATTLIKIEVTEKAAYASLVAYWFSTCFSECKSEIENKSIGSMIIDLQRHAKNTGQRLEVKGIIYHEFLKAK
jgi:hypothetical protein